MAAFWEIAAHSAYDMFSRYKYLIGNLVSSHFGFWSGNFFLIAPFPDHCLLVPFYCKLYRLYVYVLASEFKNLLIIREIIRKQKIREIKSRKNFRTQSVLGPSRWTKGIRHVWKTP